MEKEIIEYIYFFSKKIVVYLHGGPDFSIKNEDDDPFVKYLLKNKINVVIVNYPLVSGEGGTTDLKFVRCKIFAVIEKYSEYILYVLGDSYGGYLASLLTDISRIKEVIVVSGFISLRYQYLFSTERSWLKEYMDKGATDFFEIVQKKRVNSPILFIQGSADETTPIIQFDILKNNMKVHKLIGFKHREKGDKLNEVLKIILSQINK